MKPAPVDIAYLYEAFCELTDSLAERCHGQPHAGFDASEVQQLIDNMSPLAAVMRAIEQDDDPDRAKDPQHRDIHTLCEYALQLLSRLSNTAATLDAEEQAQGLENLCLPVAVWGARHGGDIRELRPVVNAIAYFANHGTNPEFMAQLYELTDEVFNAISPRLIESSDRSDSDRPWRLLVLNRAIIATRSLQPLLMEPAFDAVVEFLPEDAQSFFADALQQTNSIEFPQTVRDLLNRYYQQLSAPRTLH